MLGYKNHNLWDGYARSEMTKARQLASYTMNDSNDLSVN